MIIKTIIVFVISRIINVEVGVKGYVIPECRWSLLKSSDEETVGISKIPVQNT